MPTWGPQCSCPGFLAPPCRSPWVPGRFSIGRPVAAPRRTPVDPELELTPAGTEVALAWGAGWIGWSEGTHPCCGSHLALASFGALGALVGAALFFAVLLPLGSQAFFGLGAGVYLAAAWLVQSLPTRRRAPCGEYKGKYVADFGFVESAGDLDECNGREGVTPEDSPASPGVLSARQIQDSGPGSKPDLFLVCGGVDSGFRHRRQATQHHPDRCRARCVGQHTVEE